VGLRDQIQNLFQSLRVEGSGPAFHRTHADAPAVCSSWSGAHHALTLLHLDADAALAELRAVYELCQLDSGLLALERVLSPADRAARAAVLGEVYREDGRSVVSGPPVAAYAAARLASELGERARDLLERGTAHLDAIWGERLPPDTPLPVILHPLESGPYGSPLFDEVIEATDADEWREETGTLVRSATACQMEPDRALRAGHPFVVEDPVFCGWFLLALEESLRAWEKLGRGEAQVMKLRIRVEMIARGIADRLWWDAEEIFAGVDRARQKPLRAVTLGGLMPAACRAILEDGEAKQAIDRHLRPGVTPLWGGSGIAFNPIARDVAYDPTEVPWRGNAVSAATHYWAHLALMNARRPAEARAARVQLEELVAVSGLREFYDAISREGHGAGEAGGFSWPGLILEMQAREEAV
jgi:hypothetical protein